MRTLSFFLFILIASCSTLESQPDERLMEAIRLYTGEAGAVNDQRARELLLQSVNTGHPISMMWLARVYSTGRMTFEEDKAKAIAIASSVISDIEQLAKAGVAEANFLMGTAYAEGLGKPVDPQLAVHWYRRAAEQGNTLARHNMGNVYAAGNGVQQSDELAVYWWRLAAEKGDAIPQYRLAEMYEKGLGVKQDLEVARFWYAESAGRGYENAARALSRLDS